MSTIDTPRTTEQRQSPYGRFISDTWVNFKRRGLKAIRDRFVLVGTIIQPIIWLVLFTQVFQSVSQVPGFAASSYLDFLVPAIMILVAQFGAADAGIGLVNDIESGMFEKVLAAPVSRTAIFLGKTLADVLKLVIQAAVVLVLGLALGARVETGVVGMLGLLSVVVLYGLWYVALSTIIGLRTRNSEATTISTRILALPLLFLSSAFMPLELLPGWIQIVAQVNPITYGVTAARTIMLDGWAWNTLLPALGVLVALNVVFVVAGIVSLRRATNAKVR